MFCPNCGTQNPDAASFCPRCGTRLAPGQQATPVSSASARPAVAAGELASLGRRAGSWIIDGVLQAIPSVLSALLPILAFIPLFTIINLVMYRRGNTIGLRLVSARIVRDNGDVSGFFHTAVREAAASLSAIPLGLGYWWAFWDPMRQTWHDKIMHTYVLRDTPELARRRGTSSTAAVVWFWVMLVTLPVLLVVAVLLLIWAYASGMGI